MEDILMHLKMHTPSDDSDHTEFYIYIVSATDHGMVGHQGSLHLEDALMTVRDTIERYPTARVTFKRTLIPAIYFDVLYIDSSREHAA
jgi:hypothetical protein